MVSNVRAKDLSASVCSEPGRDLERRDMVIEGIPGVQRSWAARSMRQRLEVIRTARHIMAGMGPDFAMAIASELSRTEADTMVAELLPLLSACRFLEQNAIKILRPKRLGLAGRPFWLAGLKSEVHRVPFGDVLLICPYNYPLLLPGVQALQAFVAGNAVIWKPGRGGLEIANLFAKAMEKGGLPHGLLRVTGESIEAGQAAIAAGVDKVFFTGSAAAGRSILRSLAESLTPCVMELSGCDAVVVLPGADLDRVARALAFGMRLNGSATCMAPRRVLLVNMGTSQRVQFFDCLQRELAVVPEIKLPESTHEHLQHLLDQATAAGATVHGDASSREVRPIVVLDGEPGMQLASADIFAPVLMVMVTKAGETEGVLSASPLALTTSIFGPEREAQKLAEIVTAGTVLINDVIVPTADPRLPFGGRRGSGFGVTRGSEGLLEMTAVKVISTRRGKRTRHYEPTEKVHADLFNGAIVTAHAGTWQRRWKGLREAVRAASRMKNKG